MKRSARRPTPRTADLQNGHPAQDTGLPEDYFRIRDFEYVQPIYDLAFLLEVDALAKGEDVPKYRTFSLWRAGYSLDGYGTTIDRWLDGISKDEDLDFVPSLRIRQYLSSIRRTGSVPELRGYRTERYARCLRLRSVRGLGPSQIALTVSKRTLPEEWFDQAAINLSLSRERMAELYTGSSVGPWQSAHIIPPLLRFLRQVTGSCGLSPIWEISGIDDPLEAVTKPVTVQTQVPQDLLDQAVAKVVRKEKLFRRDSQQNGDGLRFKHQMGWSFRIRPNQPVSGAEGVRQLAHRLDPLASTAPLSLLSDLHLHTAWSDGSASVNAMANAIVASGLKHFAVTDHSRSCKLQGGLTPVLWLRQANALTLASPVCPVLHGIEVDILRDGSLDLPDTLLAAADIVVASVHSPWTEDARTNTTRLLKAIESRRVDVIAHPTSAVLGKPGVPDYVRAPAEVHWDEVFGACARWGVALEFNCFPSRLDLPASLLRRAVAAGCPLSFGSDAHARSHLINLRFGEAALRRVSAPVVLNRFTYEELKHWISENRAKRINLRRSSTSPAQGEFEFRGEFTRIGSLLKARIQAPQTIPKGSRMVGIDLTAGDKATGLALLDGFTVETSSLNSDEEILDYVGETQPQIISIDSPLGLPGGGSIIDPEAGIVRVAEQDLASIGISAYPALIDSMANLTLRGIRLRSAIEHLPHRPRVIESYPGAAQDILCIPRKQKSLDLLREGLRRLGLRGPGLDTRSHDEMDAITSAIVGRYFESGLFEPMGIPSEAQLIVPKVRPLIFADNPIICLAGKTGVGKSVVARYLSVFYGFEWIRTRDLIRELLVEDSIAPFNKKIFHRSVDPAHIAEVDLRDFGTIILEQYKQIPLRQKLGSILKNRNFPVVVDSIRGNDDIVPSALKGSIRITWFVDAPDSIIRTRLSDRRKGGEKSSSTGSPVDRTAPVIRAKSDTVLPNSGSLEDLRWRIDDALFATLRIEKTV